MIWVKKLGLELGLTKINSIYQLEEKMCAQHHDGMQIKIGLVNTSKRKRQ